MKAALPRIIRRLTSVLPCPRIRHPVFIVGCGRSGTTILGTTLSHHPQVTYLNEHRHLWIACYPETDIWSEEAPGRQGKLVLTKSDALENKSRRLHRLFREEIDKTGRPVLIEKLPINSFRLEFIHHIFPDARFIHIVRNGMEVARSIERRVNEGWYGANDYKWFQLARHASTLKGTASLPSLCTTDYDRGLLEWRLSTDAAHVFLSTLPDTIYMEIGYEDFVEKPVQTITTVLDFLGLENNEVVNDFVRSTVWRKSEKADFSRIPKKELTIGGRLLCQYRERALRIGTDGKT